jgi:hypothetical protein
MSHTRRDHPPAAGLHGDSVMDEPHKGIWHRQDHHYGDQRKMRAKAKVAIRRRDRKRLGKPTEESGVIEPVAKRTRFGSIK